MTGEIVPAQLYLDVAEVIIVALDREGIVSEINRKGCEVLGYPRDYIVGKDWFDNFIPEGIREQMRAAFRGMLVQSTTMEHFENPVLTREGGERTIAWHNILVRDSAGRVVGTLSSGEDVTELRLAAEAVRLSEERCRTLFDTMDEGFASCEMVYDDAGKPVDFRYLEVNPAFARLTGLPVAQVVGRTVRELIPAIEPVWIEAYGRVVESGRSERIQNPVASLDKYYEVHAWRSGPGRFAVVFNDLTERKRIEEELNRYRQRLEHVVLERSGELVRVSARVEMETAEHRRVEESLRFNAAILDKVAEPILVANLAGDFVYANEAASESYGFSRDEMTGLSFAKIIPPHDPLPAEARLREVVEKGEITRETFHVRKDGRRMPVFVRARLTDTPLGKFIVAVIRDSRQPGQAASHRRTRRDDRPRP